MPKKTIGIFSLAADTSKVLDYFIQFLKPPLFRLIKRDHRTDYPPCLMFELTRLRRGSRRFFPTADTIRLYLHFLFRSRNSQKEYLPPNSFHADLGKFMQISADLVSSLLFVLYCYFFVTFCCDYVGGHHIELHFLL